MRKDFIEKTSLGALCIFFILFFFFSIKIPISSAAYFGCDPDSYCIQMEGSGWSDIEIKDECDPNKGYMACRHNECVLGACTAVANNQGSSCNTANQCNINDPNTCCTAGAKQLIDGLAARLNTLHVEAYNVPTWGTYYGNSVSGLVDNSVKGCNGQMYYTMSGTGGGWYNQPYGVWHYNSAWVDAYYYPDPPGGVVSVAGIEFPTTNQCIPISYSATGSFPMPWFDVSSFQIRYNVDWYLCTNGGDAQLTGAHWVPNPISPSCPETIRVCGSDSQGYPAIITTSYAYNYTTTNCDSSTTIDSAPPISYEYYFTNDPTDPAYTNLYEKTTTYTCVETCL